MSTRIRLTRRGRKKLALYDIVVADSRAPRDGRFIEKIGSYNPNANPAMIDVLEDKALDWLMKGAQPSDTVRAMLSYKGLLLRKHLKMGVLKGAISEEEAESKYEEWKKGKDDRISQKVAGLDKKKEADKKYKLEAETKVNEARAEAIRKKNIVEEAPVEAEEGSVTTEAVASEVETAPVVEEVTEEIAADTQVESGNIETSSKDPEPEEAAVAEIHNETSAGEGSDETTTEEKAQKIGPVDEKSEESPSEVSVPIEEPVAEKSEESPSEASAPIEEPVAEKSEESPSEVPTLVEEPVAEKSEESPSEAPTLVEEPVTEKSEKSPSNELATKAGDASEEGLDSEDDKKA